jgi:hypothetical protein
MMPATQWDSKLITDLAAERARLGKAQGGGWSEGLRPADETCLLGDLAKVLAFAIAPWGSERRGLELLLTNGSFESEQVETVIDGAAISDPMG